MRKLTLIAFHLMNMSNIIIVRGSDTDVLVIMIHAISQLPQEVQSAAKVIMDCGIGNNQLSEALPGYHAFTGSDFTSAFYRCYKQFEVILFFRRHLLQLLFENIC